MDAEWSKKVATRISHNKKSLGQFNSPPEGMTARCQQTRAFRQEELKR
jgi:hypothetical protein